MGLSGKESAAKFAWLYLFVLVGLVFLVTRLFLFKDSVLPYRFDGGVYVRYIKYFASNLMYLFPGVDRPGSIEGEFVGLYILTSVLYRIKIPIEIIIAGVGIGFQALSFFIIYKLQSKEWNKFFALALVLLLSFSFVQFNTFSYAFLKAIVAITFGLATIFFIKKKSLWVAGIFVFLMSLTHIATALFFLPLILVEGLQKFNKKTVKAFLIGITVFCVGFLFFNYTAVLDKVWGIRFFTTNWVEQGMFVGLEKYCFLLFLAIPFAILGISSRLKSKKIDFIAIGFVIGLILNILPITLRTRFITYFDLFFWICVVQGFYVFYTASVGVRAENILEQESVKKFNKVLALIVFSVVILGVVQLNEIFKNRPVIYNSEIRSIKGFAASSNKEAYILTPSNRYASYVYGYSDRRTISPGLFENDPWSKEQWKNFISERDESKIGRYLSELKKPLYVYIGDNDNSGFYRDFGIFDFFSHNILYYGK